MIGYKRENQIRQAEFDIQIAIHSFPSITQLIPYNDTLVQIQVTHGKKSYRYYVSGLGVFGSRKRSYKNDDFIQNFDFFIGGDITECEIPLRGWRNKVLHVDLSSIFQNTQSSADIMNLNPEHPLASIVCKNEKIALIAGKGRQFILNGQFRIIFSSSYRDPKQIGLGELSSCDKLITDNNENRALVAVKQQHICRVLSQEEFENSHSIIFTISKEAKNYSEVNINLQNQNSYSKYHRKDDNQLTKLIYNSKHPSCFPLFLPLNGQSQSLVPSNIFLGWNADTECWWILNQEDRIQMIQMQYDDHPVRIHENNPFWVGEYLFELKVQRNVSQNSRDSGESRILQEFVKDHLPMSLQL